MRFLNHVSKLVTWFSGSFKQLIVAVSSVLSRDSIVADCEARSANSSLPDVSPRSRNEALPVSAWGAKLSRASNDEASCPVTCLFHEAKHGSQMLAVPTGGNVLGDRRRCGSVYTIYDRGQRESSIDGRQYGRDSGKWGIQCNLRVRDSAREGGEGRTCQCASASVRL